MDEFKDKAEDLWFKKVGFCSNPDKILEIIESALHDAYEKGLEDAAQLCDNDPKKIPRITNSLAGLIRSLKRPAGGDKQ